MAPAPPSGPPHAVVSGPHVGKAPGGFGIEPAVPALGTKPPLEGGNNHGLGIRADAVADGRKVGQGGGALDNPDASAAAADDVRRRLRPDSDAGTGETGPVP